jgi:aspartyl-tRNA(Asn)/glutamyl-tRNA(Gln) amidotransferase subunit B
MSNPNSTAQHAGFEAVIGLEVHVQLATASKIFSGSATAFGAEPNAQASALDLAMPGTLPVMNAAAVKMAIRFGLAVGAQIAPVSVFERKNYFYPDLPKGYQISQFERPVVIGGTLDAATEDGARFTVQLTRAHLEEDAGKSVHDAFYGKSGIDLNRAGTPLLEIVSEPCLRSAREAVAYLKALHTLVKSIKICDGNMAEGSFRCDANVSVRKLGATRLGTRAEIKNVNSFRFVEKAIDYEIDRQIRVLEAGGSVVQETRLYDAAKNETRPMRSKENSDDYRYFPDPDLPPLHISAAMIEAERACLPELPAARHARYREQLGLSDYEAASLALSAEHAEYFEATLAALAPVGQGAEQAKLVATWMMGELAAKLNATELELAATPVSAQRFAGLLARLADGTLNSKLAKRVLDAMWAEAGDADSVIARLGLKQMSDAGAIAALLDAMIAANPVQVQQYLAGNEKVWQFLIGQAMKASRGQANPAELTAILRARLTVQK